MNIAAAAKQHRPDIDGLRAIAVLSVVLFHLDKHWLPNGYLGVDVFFVISGFLITGIIQREKAEGRFSLVRFYERRLRRIAPALVVVLAVTSLFASLLLLPIDLVGYAKSLIASTGFAANIYFWRDIGYFSQDSELKPLLHLWSLGIEEQFYIFFPLVIMFLGRQKHIIWAVLLIGLGSVALNIAALQIGAASPAFYLIPTRAWELAIGALLAVIPLSTLSNGRHRALSAAGLVLVLAGVSIAPAFLPYFLPAALPAVAGAALLIWTGAMGQGAVARLLGLRWFTAIGLISYSLYLWHWPVVVFMRYYLIDAPTLWHLAIAAIVMFGLAYLSWRFVEQPFRTKRFSARRIFQLSGIAAVLLVATGGILWAGRGFPERLPPGAGRISAVVGTHYRCNISSQFAYGARTACMLAGKDHEQAKLILLGNSHAQMYAPIFASSARQANVTAFMVPANGCAPLVGVNIRPGCISIARNNLDAVVRHKAAGTVAIAFVWDVADKLVDAQGRKPDDPDAALLAGLDQTIAAIRASGKSVILVGPIATPKFAVSSEYSRALAYGRRFDKPMGVSEQLFLQEMEPLLGHYRQRPDIKLVLPHTIQCTGGQCRFFIDGDALFADGNHIGQSALPHFAPVFAPIAKDLRQSSGSGM